MRSTPRTLDSCANVAARHRGTRPEQPPTAFARRRPDQTTGAAFQLTVSPGAVEPSKGFGSRSGLPNRHMLWSSSSGVRPGHRLTCMIIPALSFGSVAHLYDSV